MIYRNHLLLSHKRVALTSERACLALIMTLFFVAPLLAQDDEMPPPPVLPPVKAVAAPDRTALEAIAKPKDRAKFALELTEKYLKRAEELTEKQEFDAALGQLGFYQGIVADTLKFLKPFREKRLREPFRNIEVALRGYVPRLEGMRRQTPVAYGVHIRAVGEYTRDARTEALNAFFDDTVLTEPATPAASPSSNGTAQPATARAVPD